MLDLITLRRAIRQAAPCWPDVRENDWPDCGPCGAVAQAQIQTGYGDKLVWCETRVDTASEWYSHWTVRRAGQLQDISGCFLEADAALLDCTFPLYRRMTRRHIAWPRCYTQAEVEFWVRVIRKAEAR